MILIMFMTMITENKTILSENCDEDKDANVPRRKNLDLNSIS